MSEKIRTVVEILILFELSLFTATIGTSNVSETYSIITMLVGFCLAVVSALLLLIVVVD